MRIGFITIGQSPRPDILSDLPESLSGVQVIESGALDGLTAQQIASLQPTDSETVHASRLRDGSEVLLAKERLIPILEEKVEMLRRNDVDAIVMLCSGEIDLRNADAVIFPYRLLRGVVESLTKQKGKIGIIVPEEKQIQSAKNEWREFANELTVVSFSPYADGQCLNH